MVPVSYSWFSLDKKHGNCITLHHQTHVGTNYIIKLKSWEQKSRIEVELFIDDKIDLL